MGVRPAPLGGRWWCATTGGNVTPGDTDRIFEKFQRGDTAAPGAGLGLFISRGLARAHGGELVVQAARRSGSEFRLTLPMGDAPAT